MSCEQNTVLEEQCWERFLACYEEAPEAFERENSSWLEGDDYDREVNGIFQAVCTLNLERSFAMLWKWNMEGMMTDIKETIKSYKAYYERSNR